MTDAFNPAPCKPEVSFDQLSALDIRVGTIENADPVPDADTLMQLRVNFGNETRTIVAGIRQERENPQEVVGQQALFVVNLAPRRIRGVTSEGMLFDIGYEDGLTPALAVPERPIPNGARAG